MKKYLFLIFLIVFICSGCDKIADLIKGPSAPRQEEAKVEGTVLAKVGSDTITLEDFKSRIDNFNQISEKQKITTFDDKKNFLQAFIQQNLFYQKAVSMGLDKDPQIKKAVEDFRKTLVVQKLIGQEIGAVNVGDKEIESYYDLAKNNYRIADEVKASEIVVANLDAAKQVLIQLLQGTDFATLAQQNSKAASARRGGDLGWIKKGARKNDRFDEVVFSLKKGEISNVFATSDGYFIVKVDDKKGGDVRPLSDVYDQVRQELLNYKQSQRLIELERDLRSKSNIEIHEELLR